MDELADRLDAAADALTTVEHALQDTAVPAAVFGADDVGRPGRFGRVLHAHWDTVLLARSREAADAAGQLIDMARALRTTAHEYAGTDEAVARRFRREA